jgi:(E)-2-((N-methylformamido)methylene)succinate hydrolase
MTLQTLRLFDGATVSYTDTDPEGGCDQVLVLLHGVGMNAAAWGPQIAALSGSHRVIALDMPGHGGSDLLAGTPDLPDYVAWAARVLRGLGLNMVNVAGHSMGALIATGLAASHPDLIARVAVLNGVYRRTPEASAAVLARAEALAKGANDIAAPLARWFTEDEAEVREQVAGWLRAVNLKGYASAYRAFATGDATYADAWPRILCPALMLTGTHDANSTPAMAQAMADAAPRGHCVILQDQRHMMNLTAPEAVTRALRGWLATPLAQTDRPPLKQGVRA